jgi:uncharacterized membrane protein HdeD (DUF308 family)
MMTRNWWSLALRGVAAIIFGVATWLWPDLTLLVFVLLFGIFAIADGLFNIAAAVLGFADEPRWLPFAMGIVSMLIGIAAIAWPGITVAVLIYFVAIWAIVTGAFTILNTLLLQGEQEHLWPLLFIGVVSILFGIAIGINPDAGAAALAWLIGAYAVLYGLLCLLLAYRLRETHRLAMTAHGEA